MRNLSPAICAKLKKARRDAGLSQTVVAAEVGCKQAALSMFEQGDGTKLNDEVIKKLAAKFGVDLSLAEQKGAVHELVSPAAPTESGLGFCPNPLCPTNSAYRVEDRTFRLPNRAAADPAGGKFCAMCGEVLEKSCPNCGAPVHSGAVCSFCGKPYVAG